MSTNLDANGRLSLFFDSPLGTNPVTSLASLCFQPGIAKKVIDPITELKNSIADLLMHDGKPSRQFDVLIECIYYRLDGIILFHFGILESQRCDCYRVRCDQQAMR
jgi:hypothetical protein